jgi:hypothetical protein
VPARPGGEYWEIPDRDGDWEDTNPEELTRLTTKMNEQPRRRILDRHHLEPAPSDREHLCDQVLGVRPGQTPEEAVAGQCRVGGRDSARKRSSSAGVRSLPSLSMSSATCQNRPPRYRVHG